MLREVKRVDGNTVVIRFAESMKIVSTVPALSIDGTFTDIVDGVVFHTVPKSFDHCTNLVRYYTEILKHANIERGVIFLTAVNIDKMKHVSLEGNTHVFATIGLEPPACIEMRDISEQCLRVSTINIVVVVNQPLTVNAMTDLLRVVAEVKAIAVADAMLRCESRACGTVTDAIAILKPMSMRDEILFAGMATEIGNRIAKAVHSIIIAEAMSGDLDTLLKRVLGYSTDELLEIFKNALNNLELPNLPKDAVVSEAKILLTKFLRDPNVWSFIIASRELDLHGIAGTIPGLSRNEFLLDSKKILADELMGMALATYLASSKVLFSMYWIEKLKENKALMFWKEPMFGDDIVSALLAALLTLILDRYLEH
jgi:alpha-ribazole phosphatase CobZ